LGQHSVFVVVVVREDDDIFSFYIGRSVPVLPDHGTASNHGTSGSRLAGLPRHRRYSTQMGDGQETNPSRSNEDEDALDDFAARPSTLPDIGIDLRCFATAEAANAVGEAVHAWLHVFGKMLNLKRLCHVIVAFNYNEALAAVDRGVRVSQPLTPTNDEIAVGIAMTPAVLRDGEARSVMVLNAEYMTVFAQEDRPELKPAREHMIYTLAHECGHVHDLGVQETSFPGIILRTELPYRAGVLFGIASGCWEEYIACRLSAPFGNDATLRAMEETFCGALERAKDRADGAIRQYRMHHDVGRVAAEVAGEYRRIMVYASYLLGHVDGMNETIETAARAATASLAKHEYFRPFFSKLHQYLCAMHASYGDWKGLEVFEPLQQLAYELLKVGGIEIQNRPNGQAYVSVPLTPHTSPSTKEQMEYFAQKLNFKQP
jgi:hypothetical protein